MRHPNSQEESESFIRYLFGPSASTKFSGTPGQARWLKLHKISHKWGCEMNWLCFKAGRIIAELPAKE